MSELKGNETYSKATPSTSTSTINWIATTMDWMEPFYIISLIVIGLFGNTLSFQLFSKSSKFK